MDEFIMDMLGNLRYAGILVLLLLGGVGFPFPEDIILLASGFLVSTGAFELPVVLLVIYPGMLAADFILYSLGKRYGRLALGQKRIKRFLTPERLKSMEDRFKKRGVLVILAGRHLAGLRAQIFLAAGITGMPPAKFLMADAASAVITITIMVGLGYRGGRSFQALREDVARLGHIAVVAVFAALVAYLLYNYFRRWRVRGR